MADNYCISCNEKNEDMLRKLECSVHSRCMDCIKKLCGDFSCEKCDQPAPSTAENVFVYMDNSNIWIEAKKLLGSASGKADQRIRIDVGRLLETVAKARIVKEAVLYGSEPPPLDTVWKEMRERGWNVKPQERSVITGKEKQVDTRFVADVTELACKTKPDNSTIVLISGDADIVPAVEVAIKENWKVEIYMWRHALSAKLKGLSQEKCKIEYLDDYRDHILFNSMKFPIAKNRRLLATVRAKGIVCRMSHGGNPTAKWCRGIERKFRERLRYFWMEELDTKTQQPIEGHLLVLVFTDVTASSFKIADIIEGNKKSKFMKDILEMETYLDYEQKSKTITPYLHTVNQYSLLDIIEKEDDDLIGLPSDESSIDPLLPSKTVEQKDLQDTSILEEPYDHNEFEASREVDDWHIVEYKRKKKKDTQLYSQPCDKGIYCQNGLKCRYKHTEAEKETFKANSSRGKKLPYKSSMCWHYPNCTKSDEQCKFAHGEEDAYCYRCKRKGHFAENCK